MRKPLSILFLCAPLGAQQAPFDADSGRTIPWPAGPWSGDTVTRMVAGDFTGDLYRDLVVVDGDDLVLAWAPGRFTTRASLGEDVTDACALADAAPTGADGLVASDDTGWRRVWIDAAQTPSVQSVATTSGTWACARALCALQPASGPPTVAALNSGGMTLLLLADPFGTASTTQVTLGGDGLDLTAVDWDGDGDDDVAVLTDQGLTVYDPAALATPLASFSLAALDGGGLAALRQAGVTGERLAAFLDPTAGAPELWVFDAAGSQGAPLVWGPSSVSIATPYALATGDVNADGSDDLLVAHRDAAAGGPIWFQNRCTGVPGACAPFAADASGVLDTGTSWSDPSGQAALPLVVDLTADGDLDVAWFSQEDAALRVAENTRVDHTAQFVNIDAPYTAGLVDWVDSVAALRVKFAPPVALPPFVPDAIRIEEWYQAGPTAPMHPVAVATFVSAWPTDWDLRHYYYTWPPNVPLDGVIHLSIRPLRTDPATGEGLEAGPACIHSFALTHGAEYLELELEATVTPFATMIEYGDLPLEVPSGAIQYPDGLFSDNSPESAGGGSPPEPPPVDEGDPPQTPPGP